MQGNNSRQPDDSYRTGQQHDHHRNHADTSRGDLGWPVSDSRDASMTSKNGLLDDITPIDNMMDITGQNESMASFDGGLTNPFSAKVNIMQQDDFDGHQRQFDSPGKANFMQTESDNRSKLNSDQFAYQTFNRDQFSRHDRIEQINTRHAGSPNAKKFEWKNSVQQSFHSGDERDRSFNHSIGSARSIPRTYKPITKDWSKPKQHPSGIEYFTANDLISRDNPQQSQSSRVNEYQSRHLIGGSNFESQVGNSPQRPQLQIFTENNTKNLAQKLLTIRKNASRNSNDSIPDQMRGSGNQLQSQAYSLRESGQFDNPYFKPNDSAENLPPFIKMQEGAQSFMSFQSESQIDLGNCDFIKSEQQVMNELMMKESQLEQTSQEIFEPNWKNQPQSTFLKDNLMQKMSAQNNYSSASNLHMPEGSRAQPALWRCGSSNDLVIPSFSKQNQAERKNEPTVAYSLICNDLIVNTEQNDRGRDLASSNKGLIQRSTSMGSNSLSTGFNYIPNQVNKLTYGQNESRGEYINLASNQHQPIRLHTDLNYTNNQNNSTSYQNFKENPIVPSTFERTSARLPDASRSYIPSQPRGLNPQQAQNYDNGYYQSPGVTPGASPNMPSLITQFPSGVQNLAYQYTPSPFSPGISPKAFNHANSNYLNGENRQIVNQVYQSPQTVAYTFVNRYQPTSGYGHSLRETNDINTEKPIVANHQLNGNQTSSDYRPSQRLNSPHNLDGKISVLNAQRTLFKKVEETRENLSRGTDNSRNRSISIEKLTMNLPKWPLNNPTQQDQKDKISAIHIIGSPSTLNYRDPRTPMPERDIKLIEPSGWTSPVHEAITTEATDLKRELDEQKAKNFTEIKVYPQKEASEIRTIYSTSRQAEEPSTRRQLEVYTTVIEAKTSIPTVGPSHNPNTPSSVSFSRSMLETFFSQTANKLANTEILSKRKPFALIVNKNYTDFELRAEEKKSQRERLVEDTKSSCLSKISECKSKIKKVLQGSIGDILSSRYGITMEKITITSSDDTNMIQHLHLISINEHNFGYKVTIRRLSNLVKELSEYERLANKSDYDTSQYIIEFLVLNDAMKDSKPKLNLAIINKITRIKSPKEHRTESLPEENTDLLTAQYFGNEQEFYNAHTQEILKAVINFKKKLPIHHPAKFIRGNLF